MGRKKQEPLPLVEIMKRLKKSTLDSNEKVRKKPRGESDDLEELDVRVKKILGLINQPKRKSSNMLFFVMYDIESNKVRRQIAKYLLREGCFRIQRSIFLPDKPSDKVDKIRTDLAAVQACYDNMDSILVVPISTDYLKAMKVIGKSIDVDIIMKTKSTLFF